MASFNDSDPMLQAELQHQEPSWTPGSLHLDPSTLPPEYRGWAECVSNSERYLVKLQLFISNQMIMRGVPHAHVVQSQLHMVMMEVHQMQRFIMNILSQIHLPKQCSCTNNSTTTKVFDLQAFQSLSNQWHDLSQMVQKLHTDVYAMHTTHQAVAVCTSPCGRCTSAPWNAETSIAHPQYYTHWSGQLDDSTRTEIINEANLEGAQY